MNLAGVTFRGPDFIEGPLVSQLPREYVTALRETNGFIAFDGGFHLRGVCEAPAWHSLAVAWHGDRALYRLFPALRDSDLPFAQDCMGDQFILREGVVYKLSAEIGELNTMDLSWQSFLAALHGDALEFLQLHPLLQFQREGGHLQPGQLLAAYPPFATKESANGVSLTAIPADERIDFLADFARQMAAIPDGEDFRITVSE
jgi:hypothetical protein